MDELNFTNDFDEFVKSLTDTSAETTEEDFAVNLDEIVDKTPTSEEEAHFKDVRDALNVSLNKLGKVDMTYISKLSEIDIPDCVRTLSGLIFQNPDKWGECYYEGYELREEYLSGNVYEKLMSAREANAKYEGRFAVNIEALSSVMPKSPSGGVVTIELGNPILTVEEIEQFVREVFKCKTVNISYSVYFNKYRVTGMNYPYMAPAYYTTTNYGIHVILEKILNNEPAEVTKTINGMTGEREIDRFSTEELHDRLDRVREAFRYWLRKNPKREKEIVARYYKKFMCFVPRTYDGDYLQIEGMNPELCLRKHQKNAIARILATHDTLLAHSVGTGKTYIMALSSQKLKQLGLIKRSMFVVPNHLVEQWVLEYKRAFPNANLLAVTPKTYTPSKRKALREALMDESLDGIIVAYSCFDRIPLSREYRRDQWQNEKLEIAEQASDFWLKREKDGLERKVNNKFDSILSQPESAFYYDELNIGMLYIDEAHNYKNLYLDTRMNNISGFNNNGSDKCAELLEKVRYTQANGRGIVFATGTPICNNLSDIYVMQRYLQNDYLRLLELNHFDKWVQMYALIEDRTEVDVVGNSFRVARRFSKFNNLPELSKLVAEFADVYMPSDNRDTGIVETIYRDEVLEKHTELGVYIEELVARAEAIKHRTAERDNMLMVTTDGRRAALDMRLVLSEAADYPNSKVNVCVRNVAKLWRATDGERSTQIVFCDQSTPKTGFNIYEEVKQKLIGEGVPAEQIAFVHDAKVAEDRRKLYRAVNKGAVRVLIGSTPKLGIGANVQERLLAIHHMDIPWRPADMVQREGRMIRQGNRNERVAVFRYVVRGSFDAYSWQVLENKQRFITQFLSGDFPKRDIEMNVDETVLSYAEVKALAVNNPDIKELIQLENKYNRLDALRIQHERTQMEMRDWAVTKPVELVEIKQTIERVEDDYSWYQRNFLNRESAYPLSQVGNSDADVKTVQDSVDNVNIDISESYARATGRANASREARTRLGERVLSAISDAYNLIADRLLFDYCGFKLYIPARAQIVGAEKVYVYLERKSRYMVDIGSAPIGVFQRIDSLLAGLGRRVNSLRLKQYHIEQDLANVKVRLGQEFERNEEMDELGQCITVLRKRIANKIAE